MLCTVGVLAASYFFIVKPTLDTTSDAIDSVSQPLREAQQQVQEVQTQAQQQANGQGGNSGREAQINLQGLQRCVQRAGQDVNALQRCTSRFSP